MERSLGVTEARKDLARIIDSVQHGGESYVIVRHGQPAAALVPMEAYYRIRQERDEIFEAIRAVQAANPDADPDQVMEQVLSVQQSLRHSAPT